MAEKSSILNMAAQANVTISALDASGLYTTEIDASEKGVKPGTRNRENHCADPNERQLTRTARAKIR